MKLSRRSLFSLVAGAIAGPRVAKVEPSKALTIPDVITIHEKLMAKIVAYGNQLAYSHSNSIVWGPPNPEIAKAFRHQAERIASRAGSGVCGFVRPSPTSAQVNSGAGLHT